MNNLAIFPKDESYLNAFDITRYNKKYWLYQNQKDENIFGVIRHDFFDKVTEKQSKKIFQFTYDGEKFVNKNMYNNKPLYRVVELLKTTKPILIVEGEKAADEGQKIFPNYFVSTWSGGCQNWKHTDWSLLRGHSNITIWPDADKPGVRCALDISRHLKIKFKLDVKVVDLPSTLPEKWDLADPIPEDIDPLSMVHVALVPDPKGIWEDIDEDIKQGRWVFIQDSFKLYWDRKRKQMIKADTLNLLYKRSEKFQGQAINHLHKHDIEIVDGTAYWPVDDEILNMGGRSYLNSYFPNNIEPLNEVAAEYLEPLKVWRDHIKNVLCKGSDTIFNYLEDTIAHDLQKPEENRTFAWIFSSKQGVGKTIFFTLLEKLHGQHNVAWVHTDNLVDKYRSFMKHCYIIFCNEIDISGQGKGPKLDKLKELITEDTHPIEQKYVDTINHKGHYRLYASSNKIIPLSADPNDRRIAFVNIDASREDLVEQDPNYFERLWKGLEDRNFIRNIFHYYTEQHVISSTFNKNEPIVTESKRELMNIGKPQSYKDLDDLFLDKSEIGPFKYDLVNTRDILEHLRFLDNQEGQRVKVYQRIDEQTIHNWLDSLGAKPIWKSQTVSLIGDKRSNRKRYKAIRNKKYWSSCNELTYMRAHMRGMFKVGDTKNAEDLERESKMSNLQGGRGLMNSAASPMVEKDSTAIY